MDIEAPKGFWFTKALLLVRLDYFISFPECFEDSDNTWLRTVAETGVAIGNTQGYMYKVSESDVRFLHPSSQLCPPPTYIFLLAFREFCKQSEISPAEAEK